MAESGNCTEKSRCHVLTEPLTLKLSRKGGLRPHRARWGHRHRPLEKRANRAETVRTPEQQHNGASKPTCDAKLPEHFLAPLPVLPWI